MRKLEKIMFVCLTIGFLMISLGITILINDMLEDHFCYELTPYERKRTSTCKRENIQKGSVHMDKESLIKARELIIKTFQEADIEAIDRLELIINVASFLEPESYDENIKVLKLENRFKRK